MIKIDRCSVPPASLAIESEKTCGSYNEADVVRQLKEDSNDKCYICELQELQYPQVEHLKPHFNRARKELVFDWDNLFYVCPHCNNVKNERKYDDKILDCCIVDPEKVLEHIYEDNHVQVHSKSEDEITQITADLIYNCFEETNTGIREQACQLKIKKLSETMGVLYRTLENYKKNPDSKRYQRSLREMLSRKSIFAAFKRHYVRAHIKDYPNLKEYVSYYVE